MLNVKLFSKNGNAMNFQSPSLRVAIVASSLRLAGAEKQTFYQARALHRAGIEARLFHLGSDGHYLGALRQAGVPLRQIYMPDKPWLMLAKLTGDLQQLRPQIVLAAQFSDLLYAIAAGRLCGALTLGGVRSDGFYELNGHGRTSSWMIHLAHGLVANSACARQNLISRGIHPGKINVLPNVIDLREFDRQMAQPLTVSLPPGRILATAVGSLHPCKRFDRFLEALALARRREPALTGVIAGRDCGVKAELQARAKELGLTPDNVIFAGEVGNVPALLARSALLALTSDYEGFPNVILEAMSARLPVLSVPAGDASHIVKHGQTGYVMEPDDVRSMAAFMIQLAQSPVTRKELGEAARKRVEQEYNSKSLAERLVAVFHDFACQHQKNTLCELLEHGVRASTSEAAASIEPQNSMTVTPSLERNLQSVSK